MRRGSENAQLVGWAVVVGVFATVLGLAACTPSDQLVCTEYANGAVGCQRFPAPLDPVTP